METHMEKLGSLLCLEYDEPRIVGMCGPAGIGKTTIARALFHTHSARFQRSCFMENVKGSCERTYNDVYGLQLHLQQQLLSEIFDHKDIRIRHLGMAPQKLKGQNVLVVLDDVDKLEQLEALARDAEWFGPGSRILVTTENKQLLEAHGIHHIYNVSFPSRDDALQIFCRYAFRKSSPPDGFRDIVVELSELAGDLPLGLRVLGSYMRNRSRDEWNIELPKLKSDLCGDIEKTLKVGYDDLLPTEQSIFLYIACLFNQRSVSYVSQLLANCRLYVESGLKTLASKSLIQMDANEYIEMHKLLVQMGRGIVRAESFDVPGKRRFLWEAEEICDVLRDNTGTETVLGISLSTSELPDEVFMSGETFKKMSSLRFLRFFKVHEAGVDLPWDHETKLNVSEGALVYLPTQLRLLQWYAYPLNTLPSQFLPQYLVRLEMQHSKLRKLWEGKQPLGNLKYMDLSYSYGLEEIPDLSRAKNLEELNLSYCTSLVTLPSSLRELNKLERLYMCVCTNLQVLPSDNTNLESLRFLDLSFCSRLKSFPEISMNIEMLEIHGTEVGEVPPSIRQWTRRTQVYMSHSPSLKTFPQFPDTVELLDLGYTGIEEVPQWIDDLYRLKHLIMNSCEKLRNVSPNICKSKHLKMLSFRGCKSVTSFPEGIFKISCFSSERNSP